MPLYSSVIIVCNNNNSLICSYSSLYVIKSYNSSWQITFLKRFLFTTILVDDLRVKRNILPANYFILKLY